MNIKQPEGNLRKNGASAFAFFLLRVGITEREREGGCGGGGVFGSQDRAGEQATEIKLGLNKSLRTSLFEEN